MGRLESHPSPIHRIAGSSGEAVVVCMQVRNGASESDIWQTIDMFKEKYSDYGPDHSLIILLNVLLNIG
jgi:hypothetical protein